jgi:hypothetical protein
MDLRPESLKTHRAALAAMERQISDIVDAVNAHCGESADVARRAAECLEALRRLSYEVEVQAFRDLHAEVLDNARSGRRGKPKPARSAAKRGSP